MTITTNTTEFETPIKPTGFGIRLKTVREGLRLSQRDAAARLHLNPDIIAIIEEERFEKGPPMIFLRGYLRSYARLLNIKEEEITQAMAQLDATNPAVSTFKKGNMPKNDGNNTFMRWMTYLIALLLLGLVAMWWRSTHTLQSPSADAAPMVEAIPQPAMNQAPEPVPAPPQATIQPTPPPAPVAPSINEQAPHPQAAAPEQAAPQPQPPQQIDQHKVAPTKKAPPALSHAEVDLPEPGLEPGSNESAQDEQANTPESTEN